MPKLIERISTKARTMTDVDKRKRMVDGDHWLDGEGWVGPRAEGEYALRVMNLIQGQFVFKNTIAEICRRHRNGLVGKEPIWNMTPKRPRAPTEDPTEEEKALINEAEAALTVWWDERDVHPAIQEAVWQLLWSQVDVSGVAYLRLYLPSGKLAGEGTERFVPRVSLEEAMDYIHVHALLPSQGGILTDSDGLPLLGYYRYKDDDDKQFLEINALAKTLGEDGSLIAPDNYAPDDTVVQVIDESTGKVVAEAGYELGGRLLTIQLKRKEVLLSDAIISQQKLMNMAYTMMGRNVVQGGFLERTIMNAQLPGKWVDDQGNPSDTGTKFEPDPLGMGAGSLTFLTGHPVKNEMGETVDYTTPSIIYRDPVPVTTFDDTVESTKRAMYEEAQQLFVLISGDAASSGQSRIQATNDFISSLGETAIPVEKGTRQLLETALAWAAYFSNQPRRFETLRAEVDVVLTAIQPTPDEVRVNLEQYSAGALSRTTTMQRNGVEDVNAEQQRIEAELEQERKLRDARIAAMNIPGMLSEGDEAQADEVVGDGQGRALPEIVS